MKRITFFICGLIAVALLSCNKDDDSTDQTDFDRAGMLQNLSSELILPAYDVAHQDLVQLGSSIEGFLTTPDPSTLVVVKEAFMKAYLSWQTISPYEFGPAEDISLKSNVNIYPIDTAKIEQNIAQGNFNFDELQNKDAKGYPALDYLLFGKNDEGILAQFTTHPNANKRATYLRSLVSDITEKINTARSEWNTDSGAYQAEFNGNTGTDVGSSLGLIVNALNQHVERDFRDGKFGIPVGIRSAGIPLPDNVEAFYSGYSIPLAVRNLEVIRDLYLGKGENGTDGLGLDDHLVAVDAQDLDTSIKNQLETALVKLNALSGPLAETIEQDQATVESLYQEFQKLVVLFKVDMPSRLGVLITYQDNDGD